ncbi:hypothetical protein [Halarsenatibacter silvermanii]|uniref:DUF4352 domain-containing protein n=1 Tax=Halarsenatibacter silvermanii TaxID=321763 RepID=A0A1G9TTN6_9FIRM|nr:hypothetical protein [Halarsenatibacter silvermanii]SDM50918.1 hypothetical protein SAMN04488692_1471 [Halarsenatibacter silvermanii]
MLKKRVFTLMLVFLLVLAFSVSANSELITDPQVFLENAEENLEEGNEFEAFGDYLFAYHLLEDENKKSEIKEEISELRESTGAKHSFSMHEDKEIMGEVRPADTEKKQKYGVNDYTLYKLNILNHSGEDIELNAAMTRITGFTKRGDQYQAVNAMEIMGLDISLDNLNELQSELPANQRIYDGGSQSLLLLFEKDFEPRRLLKNLVL